MADCSICGEKIPAGSRTCSVCGSSVDEFPAAPTPPARTATSKVVLPTELPPGGSYCPGCGKTYEADYADTFCVCGTGLLKELESDAGTAPAAEEPVVALLEEEAPMAVVEEAPPMAVVEEEAPMAVVEEEAPMAVVEGEAPMAVVEDEAPMAVVEEAPVVAEAPPAVEEANAPGMKVRSAKPSPGTPCLVLYGPDKKPLQYFPLTKDAMLIGRLDAVAGNFPDIDLDEWFDRPTIRRISRQHALILRTRATGSFALRPLTGNTGTQLESQMLAAAQDYPLQPGHRIILGGVIRLKFEIA
jgi:hypothetical protein